MTSSFDAWADVYDSVYSYLSADIPFYVNAACEAGSTVLELGCGTGRITIPIAEAGINIIGLDSSNPMLEIARRKSQSLNSTCGDIKFVHADMRDFTLSTRERYNLVIIPFRGFLCLLTVEDQIKTLSNIKRHLAPNGKLIFDIFVPDLNMLVQESDVLFHFRDVTESKTGNRMVLWHQGDFNNHDQIISTRVIADELDENGEMIRRFYRDFQIRYSHRWEIQHLLKMCGFETTNLFGDFKLSEFDDSSKEMVWVAYPQK